MIRVLALDFDGVVLESVSVKLDAFKRLFGNDAATNRYLDEHNGVDRYTKFRHITTKMQGKSYDEKLEAKLDADFSNLILEAVLACPFVPGAEAFLRENTLPLYVISAMPLCELKIIVDKRGLANRFKGLFGSPGKKAEQLRELLVLENLSPSELVFVGDADNDRKAAADAGVAFIGRRNAEEFKGPTLTTLPDLKGLTAALAGVAR